MQEFPIAIAAPCIPAPECAGQTDAFRRWNAETAAASGSHTCLPYVYVLSKCIADQRNGKSQYATAARCIPAAECTVQKFI